MLPTASSLGAVAAHRVCPSFVWPSGRTSNVTIFRLAQWPHIECLHLSLGAVAAHRRDRLTRRSHDFEDRSFAPHRRSKHLRPCRSPRVPQQETSGRCPNAGPRDSRERPDRESLSAATNSRASLCTASDGATASRSSHPARHQRGSARAAWELRRARHRCARGSRPARGRRKN